MAAGERVKQKSDGERREKKDDGVVTTKVTDDSEKEMRIKTKAM